MAPPLAHLPLDAAWRWLAVVPLRGRPPSFWQSLLDYAPLLLVGAVVVLAALAWHWTRGRQRSRLVVIAAAAAVSMGAGLWHWARQPADIGPFAPVAGQWTTFQANMQRTGTLDAQPGPLSASVLWTFTDKSAPAAFAASAAVVGEHAFVGCDNGTLYCLRAASGQVVWRFRAAHPIFAAPVVADGRLYVGEGLHETNNAKLYCLDAATGRKLWDLATSGHIEFSPTLAGGRLYFGAGGDGLYCVDAATGRQLWHYRDVHVDLSPAVTPDGVFFGAGYGQTAFYRLSPADGSLIWKRPVPTGVAGSPSTDGQRVYFGVGNGTFAMSHAAPQGGVWCVSAADGQVLWRTTQVKDTVLTAIALNQGAVCFGSRDGNLYCLDAATGAQRWSFDAAAPILSSPAWAGGAVYFGCDDGIVRCLDAATGRLIWQWDSSQTSFSSDVAIMASPVLAAGCLYVGSTNGSFYRLGTPRPPRDATEPDTGLRMMNR